MHRLNSFLSVATEQSVIWMLPYHSCTIPPSIARHFSILFRNYFAVANSASVIILVNIKLHMDAFIFASKIPKSRSAKSEDKCIFNFN